MTPSRRYVINQTLLILAGEAVCTAAAWAVFALLDKFDAAVFLGSMVGMLAATGNFFALAVAATLAADMAEKQDVEGAQKLLRGSYPIRLVVMAAVLFLCGKSGYFNVIAMALPLLAVRPIIAVSEFLKKKEE